MKYMVTHIGFVQHAEVGRIRRSFGVYHFGRITRLLLFRFSVAAYSYHRFVFSRRCFRFDRRWKRNNDGAASYRRPNSDARCRHWKEILRRCHSIPAPRGRRDRRLREADDRERRGAVADPSPPVVFRHR